MQEVYSPLQQQEQEQRSINKDEKRAYGSPINTNKYDYFPITILRQSLKYCSNTKVDPEDYLFVSLNGGVENATLFGQAKNYNYTTSGPDYVVIYWKKAEDETDNITNVPIKQVNATSTPIFVDVGIDVKPNFFVERPKDETPPTCFKRFMNSLNGSGTKRRRKNKRNSSNKKRKQRKSSNKRRRH